MDNADGERYDAAMHDRATRYNGLYMRYLGVLKLLEECSPHVDEETRGCIEQAFADAVREHDTLKTRSILNRLEIDVKMEGATP